MGGRALDLSLALTVGGWAIADLVAGRAATLVGACLVTLNLTVAMLFLRRHEARRTASISDAFLCMLSVPVSALALKLAPLPAAWPLHALVLFGLGTAAAVFSLSTLGRSFGVLPALRRVVSKGPFQLVRHPVYAAELLMVLACSLAASQLSAMWPALLALLLVVVRILLEERLLEGSAQYRSYQRQVRWRLVPRVW